MTRPAVILVLAAFALCPRPSAGETGDLAAEIAALEARGARIENSEAERAAFARIEAACRRAGLETWSGGFAEASEGHSFSRIVEARIRGVLRDELAVVASVDSWIDARGREDGAYSLALALHEAARLAARRSGGGVPPVSIRFVFLGAERRGRSDEGRDENLGARTWIRRSAGSSPLAVLYLDMDRAPESIRVANAAKRILSPFWLYDRTRLALESSGMPIALEANRLQLYRLGIADRTGPIGPFLRAGIPAIELEGLGAAREGAVSAEWFDRFIDRFLDENSTGFLAAWDRHYLIFQLGRLAAAVRETSYVSFLVAFAASAVAIFLAMTVVRREGTKALLGRTPVVLGQLFALYVVLSAVLLAGSGMGRLEAAVLGSSEAWRLAPRVFAAVRLGSILLLFLGALSILVERRALSPNPYFYEFASLACLGVDIFLFAAIQLPASFYFIWAFAVAALSLAARRPWATLVAYLVMYAPLALLGAELAARPEPGAYRLLIAPDRGAIFVLAALALPFFAFTASPLLFYAPRGAEARRRIALGLVAAAFAAEAGVLGYAALGPASRPVPGDADLTVSESLDQDAGRFTATLEAKRRIGELVVLRGGAELSFASRGDRATVGGEDRSTRIRLGQTSSRFLDRANLRIRMAFADPPYRLAVSLTSGGELHIYDCDFPFKIALDGRSASISVGANPGSSLDLELTVPANFAATLSVTAEYLEPPSPYRFLDGSAPRPGRFDASASIPISGGEPR